MSILPSEVIAQTIQVLEDVCLLLDDEIDERRREPSELPREVLKLADALQSVHALLPKLQTARDVLAAPNLRQANLQLSESDDL